MTDMKRQADQMLASTGVLDVLSQHGVVHLHGSHDLDLMVWPELDIGLEVPTLTRTLAFELITQLSQRVSPTVAMVINQVDHPPVFLMNVTRNYLIDFRFAHEGVEWKLDVMVVDRDGELTGPRYNAEIKRRMTPTAHQAILSIKRQVIDHPLYRKTRWQFTSSTHFFGAHDIYQAVFDFGVTTAGGFASYLRTQRSIELRGDPPSS